MTDSAEHLETGIPFEAIPEEPAEEDQDDGLTGPPVGERSQR